MGQQRFMKAAKTGRKLKTSRQPEVEVYKVTKGQYVGQFRFRLYALNGEMIATSEQYTQKHNAVSVLKKYFSNFEIIDKTK